MPTKSKPEQRYGVPRSRAHHNLIQPPPPIASNPIAEPKIDMSPVYRIPTLYPVYFTYSTQHLLLGQVQGILEEALFDFAKNWVPRLLEQTGWDTAAAGELSEWPLEIDRFYIPQEAVTASRGTASLKHIIADLRTLRHAAVHRLPTCADEIHKMIGKSLILTKTVKDGPRTSQLEKIFDLVIQSIHEIEIGKDSLEDGLVPELQKLQNQKDEAEIRIMELDKMANRAGEIFRDNDTKLREQIGKRLEMKLEFAATKVQLDRQSRTALDYNDKSKELSPPSQGPIENHPSSIFTLSSDAEDLIKQPTAENYSQELLKSNIDLQGFPTKQVVHSPSRPCGLFEFRGKVQSTTDPKETGNGEQGLKVSNVTTQTDGNEQKQENQVPRLFNIQPAADQQELKSLSEMEHDKAGNGSESFKNPDGTSDPVANLQSPESQPPKTFPSSFNEHEQFTIDHDEDNTLGTLSHAKSENHPQSLSVSNKITETLQQEVNKQAPCLFNSKQNGHISVIQHGIISNHAFNHNANGNYSQCLKISSGTHKIADTLQGYHGQLPNPCDSNHSTQTVADSPEVKQRNTDKHRETTSHEELPLLGENLEAILRSTSVSPVQSSPNFTSRTPASRACTLRTPAAKTPALRENSSAMGRRVITPSRRGIVIIDLTDGEDCVVHGTEEPRFLLRKRIAPENEQPAAKKQKIEGQIDEL